MLSGLTGTWRVVAVSALVLTLEGATLAAATRTATVPGSHGGITVIHGGGNALLTLTGSMTGGAGSLTRSDGLAWSADGFVVGQRVQLDGEPTTRVILGFADATCPAPAPGETGFPGCGVGAVMLLSGGVVAGGERTVHVAKPLKVQADAPMTLTEDPLGPSFGDVPTVTVLTRHDGGSFVADGFLVGMQVWITAVAGPRTITALDAATLTLGGTELTGLYASSPTPITVFGYDPALDGGVLVGGDTIIVCNPDAVDAHGDPVPCGDVVGGPELAAGHLRRHLPGRGLGSGDPATVDGRDFGLKPFDPFYPGAGPGRDLGVPVADPYDHVGNGDVIDVSHLFAGVPVATMPTVGLTVYGGGAGNGHDHRQPGGDHLAGGLGEDTILGQGGLDHSSATTASTSTC